MNQLTEALTLFGALAGGAIGATDWKNLKGKWDTGRSTKRAAIGLVLGAIVGVLLGVLFSVMH
ncbi:hypothetical protein [Sulfoacidibacillus thermotolerans]|uniref:Uncharacterized protein n=1 Tax=Sulfoacidibacillus thermotolerans TaxID=1765684 RepID=A0A2U3D5N5_SULT2|nr:hypothetical protein [Sulfoacidibacillus thermotolerans]PWI56594.1 hypothetical protein BM613_12900 [Sulfoacidibacillus thermotolerans]